MKRNERKETRGERGTKMERRIWDGVLMTKMEKQTNDRQKGQQLNIMYEKNIKKTDNQIHFPRRLNILPS